MHDTLIQVLFYLFAGVAVLSAIMVITQNNPVRCVLFLVLTFFASSVLWLLLEAEFLAIILVLVYVGAVMTLFLFVVMMLNIDIESMRKHFAKYLPFGLILVAMLTSLLYTSLPKTNFQAEKKESLTSYQTVNDDEALKKKPLSNTESIGMVLYTDYVLAFELASVLLLVAIVAAITLAHRTSVRSKRQDVKKQIMTRSSDRVELVKMKSEKQL